MSVKDDQQRFNEQSRSGWDVYSTHRNRVTQLLLESPARERLCILGAGNGNDLDLPALLNGFREVVLVDLDVSALEYAASSQNVADHPGLRLLGDVDLTGIAAQLDQWPANPAPALIQQLIQDAAAARFDILPGDCSAIASVGLLSQLLHCVLSRISDPGSSVPLLQAVRLRHLRLLLECCAPGGRAVLITEVVSSDTTPELPAVAEPDLPAFLARQLACGNFFTGLHPGLIRQSFETDAILSRIHTRLESPPPWLWQFVCRTYAVTAFVAHR